MRATETNRRRSALLGAGMVMVAGMMAPPADAAENMRFHGTLVAEPCVIQPGDEDIQLDFGTIVDKYLYLNTRTHSQTFALHLTECDLSLGNTVAITFTGTENAKLPGLLALDAGSLASGIGIGLEDSSGKALPLNRASATKLRRLASAAPMPTSTMNSGISGAVASRMMPAAQLIGKTAIRISSGMKTARYICGR